MTPESSSSEDRFAARFMTTPDSSLGWASSEDRFAAHFVTTPDSSLWAMARSSKKSEALPGGAAVSTVLDTREQV